MLYSRYDKPASEGWKCERLGMTKHEGYYEYLFDAPLYKHLLRVYIHE
jgi:hypothetical protein